MAKTNKRPDFTDEQRRAIFENGNIIVSAGAGSGKTTVMIERITEKIKSGAKTDEMLIVTFMRASAADMRVKLSERLSELRGSGNASAIEDALDSLPSCKIGTLHSYCQRLIRTYFFAAGYDPMSAVIDEGEAFVLKRNAARAATDAARVRGDNAFNDIYDILSSRKSDDGFINAVIAIMDFAMSVCDTDKYLSDIDTDAPSRERLRSYCAGLADKILQKAEALSAELADNGMEKELNAIAEFKAHLSDSSIALPATPAHKAKNDITDVLSAELSELRGSIVRYDGIVSDVNRACEIDSAPYVNALLAVVRDAYSRYTERKRRAGKLDYSDLEHGALRVLSDKKCLEEITRGIKYVFIDEFQDVNPLQSEIAAKFKSSGAEMFVVGDVKQSIFGFRCCSPEHFKKVRGDSDYTHINLNANFRSTNAVIEFINKVFEGVMTEKFGGADYTEEKLVYANTDMAGGSAEFWYAPAQKRERVTAATPEYSVKRAAANAASEDAQALFVADKITEWVKENPDAGLRSVAVLVRAADTPFTCALKAELFRRGIRFSLGNKPSARQYPAVVCLLDILRCTDDRRDDVALLTALRSPMGGFSDAELAELSSAGEAIARKRNVEPDAPNGRYSFVKKIECYRGRLYGRLAAFFALRDEITEYSYNHDSSEVLGFITSRIDYFQYVYETGGNARAVEAFINAAADRRCDAHTFISYCDNADFELDFADSDDSVTISTMHSCKGLEYDFVIVADVSHKFNEGDIRRRYTAGARGVTVCVPGSDGLIVKSAPGLLENIIIPEEQKQEELRLLYVAMTRARKKLIVCGVQRDMRHPADAESMYDFMGNADGEKREIHPSQHIQETEKPAVKPADAGVIGAVRERFDRAETYKVSELPVKTCVTALAENEFDETAVRTFVLTEDDRGDTRKRGTAYHKVMERIDFDSPDFEAACNGVDGAEFVQKEEIMRAAQTVSGLVRGAEFVARERYFIVDLPAESVGGGEGGVLVQGVIDLLIADGDGNATVVDYKTGDPERLKNAAYAKQLCLYAQAVERATPYKVTRKCLYSFASGELIDL